MHVLSLALSALPLAAAAHSPPRRHRREQHPEPQRRDFPAHLDRYRREGVRDGRADRRDVVDGIIEPASNGSASLGAVGMEGTTVSGSGSAASDGTQEGAEAGTDDGQANGWLSVVTVGGGGGATPTSAGSQPSSTSSSSGSAPTGSSGSGSSGSGSGGNSSGTCFPMGGAKLPADGSAPSGSKEDWWCSADKQTGFLGFSHALESKNCNDPTNKKETLVKTFGDMKANYGASMVRIYAPECRQASFWTDVLEAAAENNMGVIPMVWWGFGDGDAWQQSEAQLVDLVQNNPLAKYVVHSMAFGSEPIGDGVDGGYENFVSDLKTFRAKVNAASVDVAISEDWDRPGIMTSGEFDTLASVGEQIKANTDLVQAHIMPYYHADEVSTAFQAWPYFQKYIQFLNAKVGKQILITESPWSFTTKTYHGRGTNTGVSLPDYTFYWKNVLGSQKSCEFFKSNGVGWFMHSYENEFETGFGLIQDDGKAIIDFKPATC